MLTRSRERGNQDDSPAFALAKDRVMRPGCIVVRAFFMVIVVAVAIGLTLD
jgi:hypothetical protein